MPQMMPMYWMIMMITTMILLIIIMNFIYFLMINPIFTSTTTNPILNITYKWNWKW